MYMLCERLFAKHTFIIMIFLFLFSFSIFTVYLMILNEFNEEEKMQRYKNPDEKLII